MSVHNCQAAWWQPQPQTRSFIKREDVYELRKLFPSEMTLEIKMILDSLWDGCLAHVSNRRENSRNVHSFVYNELRESFLKASEVNRVAVLKLYDQLPKGTESHLDTVRILCSMSNILDLTTNGFQVVNLILDVSDNDERRVLGDTIASLGNEFHLLSPSVYSFVKSSKNGFHRASLLTFLIKVPPVRRALAMENLALLCRNGFPGPPWKNFIYHSLSNANCFTRSGSHYHFFSAAS